MTQKCRSLNNSPYSSLARKTLYGIVTPEDPSRQTMPTLGPEVNTYHLHVTLSPKGFSDPLVTVYYTPQPCFGQVRLACFDKDGIYPLIGLRG